VIFILTLFTVIAASRPVNKNVNTGAVIRAKGGTDQTIGELSNRWSQVQTHERLEWKNRISLFRFWTHSQIHSLKRVAWRRN